MEGMNMRKFIEDIIHAGVGLTQITKEQVEKIFNELKKRGEVYEKDRDQFIKKTLERMEKAGKEVTEKIKDTLSPGTKQMEELNKKIDALMKEIEELKKKKA